MIEHSLFISFQAQSDLFWDGVPHRHLIAIRLMGIDEPFRSIALSAAMRTAMQLSTQRLANVIDAGWPL